MPQVALHYYRYLSSTATVSKVGGGTITLNAGWYNLSTVLAALRVGSVTCSWSSTTNRTAFSPGIAVNQVIITQLLGLPDGSSYTAGTLPPMYSFVPYDPEYMQDLAPVGVEGKRQYDTDYYTTQTGQVGALGVVDIYTERFTLNLVKKQDVFTISGDGGLSSPFNSVVYRPDLGITFEIKVGDDIGNSAGYAVGTTWVHVDDPEIIMQMPPWDLYYTVNFEANKYVP
jgi:hypothetical protein